MSPPADQSPQTSAEPDSAANDSATNNSATDGPATEARATEARVTEAGASSDRAPDDDVAPAGRAPVDRARDDPATTAAERSPLQRLLIAIGVGTFVAVMAVFWTWALFIADPEPVNRIGDRAWAMNAEKRCAETRDQLAGLANYTVLEPNNPALIAGRADIIEQANTMLTAMIDDLDLTEPTDAKGRAVTDAWLDDYRTYLGDRENYVEALRTTGENLSIAETRTDAGIPISELLETFAGDNNMPSCAPPRDLR